MSSSVGIVEGARGLASDARQVAGLWALTRAGDPGARLTAPGNRRDPYPEYARIRAAGDVARSRLGWFTAHHDAVSAVLRGADFGHDQVLSYEADARGGRAFRQPDPRTLLDPSDPAALVDPLGPESMIGVNPPDHTRLRGLVAKVFTPRRIEALRPRVQEMAAGLLHERTAGGAPAFDVVPDFAAALPVMVICEVLGIPPVERRRFSVWGDDLAASLDSTARSGARRRATTALRELHVYFQALFEERRRDPGEDLVSQLIAVEQGGEKLTSRELMATCLLLFLAGFETTVNLLSNGTLALLRHPDQAALLREEPVLLPGAVEEVLRYDPPVQLTGRWSLRDTRLRGTDVPAGTFVVTLLGGANRDPAVFADPDRFDVTRANARAHLSFIAGPHHCLGASLARLEGEVGLGALLEAFPDLAPGGPVRRRSTFVLRGLESLPLRGAPRRPVATP